MTKSKRDKKEIKIDSSSTNTEYKSKIKNKPLRQAIKTISISLSVFILFTLFSYFYIQIRADNIYSKSQQSNLVKMDQVNVAIVFGGGVTEEYPLPLLKDRLDTAKDLLDAGLVSKLILSGDNRSLDYNEPGIMFRYLVGEGVVKESLQADFAGRSTYETCERASKIFGLSDVYLVSESTHLPRAVFLCEHFGIKSYGIESDGQSSKGLRLGQRWRELLARDKAIINAYIMGEKTVLGDPIDIK